MWCLRKKGESTPFLSVWEVVSIVFGVTRRAVSGAGFWIVGGWGALAMVAAVLAGSLMPALAGAVDGPYAADPLGLFAEWDETSYYTTRPDTFEVSICNPDRVDPTLGEAVDYLNNETGLREYWSSVSNGKYSVRFVAGTNVTSHLTAACWTEAQKQASGRYAAGFVLQPPGIPGASEGSALIDSPAAGRTWGPSGSNGRVIQVDFVAGPDLHHIWADHQAHLMGLTFNWPSSFTGVLHEDNWLYQLDNPMDVMSGSYLIGGLDHSDEVFEGLTVGTIAANRYAAGWIAPSDVHVFGGGTDRVTLHATWEAGMQMLVVPSGQQGYFLTFGVRVAKYHDRGIPEEGVESYVIDQRPRKSPSGPDECRDEPCAGQDRRTTPYPHSTDTSSDEIGWEWPSDPTMHVSQPGDEFTWNDTTIRVVRRIGDAYEVEISDETPAEDLFTDDDGSVHEDDINRIASLGITRGCATEPEPLFCPDRSVTRAEMAAFLLRAIGEPNPPTPTTNPYDDMADNRWYTNYALRIAQLGVDTGADGLWRPNDPLTRLEMAEWLTRMFDHINQVNAPQGLFEDVTQQHWPVVEGLYQTGITRGCSTDTLLYCPDETVTRAQMASFIIRALPKAPDG